ncbi:MAG: efflux RND transporter permease subunit [Bacteroides sp.]|nr:efflux RND transporter permease subunit [Prevotella sp.]MCM1408513.1 efflux RND transporter permease subunit [Treponema brennaborense]MCM1469326.1 efflux RND transporter permease subunit [Bacteroides sp.]
MSMRNFLKHPKLIVFVCAAITVALALPLASVFIENSVRVYMPTKSDSYKTLLETEEQFGSMLSLGISLEAHDKSTILTPEYISVIQKISERVENLEGIESLDSVSNIDFVYSLDGGLAAGKIVDDDYAGTANDIKSIKEKIVDWQDMYNRVVIDDTFTAAQVAATLDPSLTPREQVALLNEVRKITAEEIKGHNLEARFFGDPVLSDNAMEFMISDLINLIPLVVLVVLVSLYLSFHTISGTLLPLATVLMSTVWTCGLMALFGVKFTIIASVIPVALIACGSAYGIHVMTHYYAFLEKAEGEMTYEKHLDAVCAGLSDVWVAVLLAGVTTIAGFISLVTSPIIPLKSFSIFTALGIAFALLLSITFVPAMLLLTPLKSVGKKRGQKLSAKVKTKLERELKRRGGISSDEANGKTLYNIYHFFTGTKSRLVVFAVVIVACSVWGVNKLIIDTSMVNYFPASSEFRKDLKFVDENFAGSNSLYFVISGQEKGDMTKPEILKAVDDMQFYLDGKYSEIGKIVSFTTFVKRMNQVMHVPMNGAAEIEAASFGGDFAEDDWDDWGDSSDEWADSGDDWGSDDWGDSAETAEDAANEKVWIDPNIEYAKTLQSQITVQDALKLFADAYTAAGGKNATVQGMTTELQKALNYNGLAYYEVPYDLEKYPAKDNQGLANLVSQYLLLYSGSLDRFSDDQLAPKSIRMQVQLRSHNTAETKKIISDAQEFAETHFPEGYTITPTGTGEMELAMTEMVISNQFVSIIFSIAMVFVIIALSFKSPVAGIIGAIPLAFTIILNFMTMGFTGIRLDWVTSIIASVAIGIGIDYTIHFMESYKAQRGQSRDVEEVTLKTFAVAGHGILTNALAVGLGFLVLVLSKFAILRCIGILVAIVMFSSSFLAMTVIPGILNAFDPKFMQSKEEREEVQKESQQ